MKNNNRSRTTKAERKAQQLANQENKPFAVIGRKYVYPLGSQVMGVALAPVFYPEAK
jgi:hypothetical protein